jgi:hypothetical protein
MGMSRAAAYGELVAGILDVRDQTPTQRFDDALRAAVAAGRLDPRTAAELRWLQRESVQALVEHARTALPAALLGIDDARAGSQHAEPNDLSPSDTGPAGPAADEPGRAPRAEDQASAPRHPVWATVPLRQDVGSPWPPSPLPPEPESAEEPAEPTVRRLLVAGLTSLTGPSGHG